MTALQSRKKFKEMLAKFVLFVCFFSCAVTARAGLAAGNDSIALAEKKFKKMLAEFVLFVCFLFLKVTDTSSQRCLGMFAEGVCQPARSVRATAAENSLEQMKALICLVLFLAGCADQELSVKETP